MSCSSCGTSETANAAKKKNCGCFASPTACCMRRPDFIEIETVTAFNKIDQKVPCFDPILFPGPSVQVSNTFGNQVAFSRDAGILVVTYRGLDTPLTVNAGSVYVFERKPQFASCVDDKCEKYALRQILTPPERYQVSNLQFGNTVAISSDGDRIAIGAPSFGDTISGISHDAVFIYDRLLAGEHCSSSPWKFVQRIVAQRCEGGKIIADNGQTFNFGYTVRLSGNGKVLVVGSTTFEDSPPSATAGGNAYIYVDECTQFSPCVRQTEKSVFSFAQRITRDEFAANIGMSGSDAVFPGSIAINETGSTVALSMPGITVSDISVVGAVQIYRRCGIRKHWSFNQSIPLSEPANATNLFGITMMMTPNGRYLVIETTGDRKIVGQGFVTIYPENCTCQCPQYSQDGDVIRAKEAERDSNLVPQQVAISDDGCLLAVGWEFTSVSDVSQSGKVDVYERNCTAFNNDLTKPSYTLRQEIFANQQVTNQEFGFGVALSGNGTTLAIGASATAPELGAVQIYSNDCRK